MPLPTSTSGDGQITNPTAYGYDVLITESGPTPVGTYFQSARPRGEPLVIQPEAPDEALRIVENPEDRTAASGLTFSRNDFGGGEGLWLAHNRDSDPTDLSRFWTSRDVDVEPPKVEVDAQVPTELKLAREFVEILNGNTLGFAMYRYDEDTLFIFKPEDIFRITGLADAVPTLTLEDAGVGSEIPVSLVVIGGLTFALWGDFPVYRIRQRSTAGGWSDFKTSMLEGRLFAAKGRLFFFEFDANSLIEFTDFTDSTQTVTILNLPDGEVLGDTPDTADSFTEEVVIDAGAVILMATTRGRIFSFDSVDGALFVASEMTVPFAAEGEWVTSMAHYAGIVYVGTAVFAEISPGNVTAIGRLWRFDLSGPNLVNGQLLKVWGVPHELSAKDYSPQSMVIARGALWIAARHGLPQFPAADRAIWRYDLATGGLSNWALVADDSGDVFGSTLVAVGTGLFITAPGEGLFREEDTYAANGELYTSLIDWFSADPKQYIGLKMQVKLPSPVASSKVDVYYTTDPEDMGDPAGGWRLVKSFTADDDGTTEYPILDADDDNPVGRYVALRIVLTSNTAKTDTPRIRSYSIRAYATEEDIVLNIPINVSDIRQRPNHKPRRVRGLGASIRDRLRSYQGNPVDIVLLRQDSSVTYRGQIETVTEQQHLRSDRGTQGLSALVRFKGRKV